MEENEKRKAEVDDNGVGGWKMKKTKQREEEEEEGWLSPWLDIAQWRKQKPPNPPQLVWRRPSSLSLFREERRKVLGSQSTLGFASVGDERPLSCPQNV